MSENKVVIAGRPVPKGVTSWTIFDAEGRRKTAPANDGAEASEFGIAQLSTEAIRATWGPGTYRVQFLTESNGKRKPRGSRIVTINAPSSSTQPAEVAPAAPAAFGAGGPLAEALNLFAVINGAAQQQAQQSISLMSTMLSTAMGGGNAGMTELVRMLAAEQRQTREMLTGLLARVSNTSPDDDDEEDDDDEDAGDARAPLFRPGKPVTEVAVAEALNGIVDMIRELAPAAKPLIAAKLARLASEVGTSPTPTVAAAAE